MPLKFWSVYVPCGAQYLDAVKQTLEQIDLIKRMVDRYSDYLRLAVDAKGKESRLELARRFISTATLWSMLSDLSHITIHVTFRLYRVKCILSSARYLPKGLVIA